MTLRTYDVSPAHARRLRERCHARLQARPRRNPSFARGDDTRLRQAAGPVLGAAWCLAYLLAIIRFAAAVYGL